MVTSPDEHIELVDSEEIPNELDELFVGEYEFLIAQPRYRLSKNQKAAILIGAVITASIITTFVKRKR